jgi:hypothetical protein
MTEEQKNNFLKDEYLKLQDIYEDFDRRSLTIKSWTITVCFGGIAIGFEKDLISLWIFSSIVALLFWWLEAKWKTFQYSNSLRIKQIEAYFRGDTDYQDITPLQIYHSWFLSYLGDGKIDSASNSKDSKSPRQKTIQNAQLSLVYTPYLYIVLIDLVLIFLKLANFIFLSNIPASVS